MNYVERFQEYHSKPVWALEDYGVVVEALRMSLEGEERQSLAPLAAVAELHLTDVPSEWGDSASWSAEQQAAIAYELQGRASKTIRMHNILGNFDRGDELLRQLFKGGTWRYFGHVTENVRARAHKAEAIQDLAPSQGHHQEFHDFVDEQVALFKKARKSERREKIRNSLHRGVFTDADICSPIVGALCRIESPQAAADYLEECQHATVTSVIGYCALFEEANSRELIVPLDIQRRADSLLALTDPGLIIYRKLREYLSLAAERLPGHRPLNILSDK